MLYGRGPKDETKRISHCAHTRAEVSEHRGRGKTPFAYVSFVGEVVAAMMRSCVCVCSRLGRLSVRSPYIMVSTTFFPYEFGMTALCYVEFQMYATRVISRVLNRNPRPTHSGVHSRVSHIRFAVRNRLKECRPACGRIGRQRCVCGRVCVCNYGASAVVSLVLKIAREEMMVMAIMS